MNRKNSVLYPSRQSGSASFHGQLEPCAATLVQHLAYKDAQNIVLIHDSVYLYAKYTVQHFRQKYKIVYFSKEKPPKTFVFSGFSTQAGCEIRTRDLMITKHSSLFSRRPMITGFMHDYALRRCNIFATVYYSEP